MASRRHIKRRRPRWSRERVELAILIGELIAIGVLAYPYLARAAEHLQP